jgi:hypothetical protein
MKRIEQQLFSNGSEHCSWISYNCEKCVKFSRYNEKKDTYSQFRCSIDKDIQMQAAGIVEAVNVKSAEAVELAICPYLETERKVKVHRPIKNQLMLEL